MSPDGVLVVDKPAGMTSAHVVARVKRILRARRAGHTGTLDPMATGVLPVVVGEGTKLSTWLICDDKEYTGELELGVVTDTLDAEGKVLGRREVPPLERSDVEAAMARFVGRIAQVPPAFSALKKDGKRLYELARKGVEVAPEPREVEVQAFELLGFEPPRLRFRVACGKGTYVRSLARDLGEALGPGACLTALRRTRSGPFTLAEAVSLDAVAERGPGAVIPPARALGHLPGTTVTDGEAEALRRGQRVAAGTDWGPGPGRLLDPAGRLVAVAEIRSGNYRTLRVFR